MTSLLPILISTIVLITNSGQRVTADPLVVETKYGSVRGILNDKVRVFHGVPYAKPPVGDLRWRPPAAPNSWAPKIFDATKRRQGCPQDCSTSFYCTNSTSEDCLFLEIYVPAEDVRAPLPVMVYLHGGSFKDLSCTLPVFDSTKFVSRSGVIVVLVEYRLGALGFLVTGKGKDQATGNYGLLDQTQALIWVKDNIKFFGGDPNKVTVVGQSAGAQSVLIHLVSDVSSRLFCSAIVESAALTLPYKTPEVASKHGKTFAKILNCVDKKKGIDMVCLRTKTTTEIISAQKTSTNEDFNNIDKIEPYAPIIDGDLVKMQPLDALKQYAETSKHIKPTIWGYTTEETQLFVKGFLPNPVPALMAQVVMAMFVGDFQTGIEKLYPIEGKDDTREEISKALTDYIFRCPLTYIIKLLKKIGQSEEMWLYAWDRPLEMEYPNEFAQCNGRTCHGIEIPFVFQTFSSLSNVSNAKDIQLSNFIIDYFANFMKFGNPNGDTKKNLKKDKQIPDTSPSLQNWPNVLTNEEKGISRLVFSRNGSLNVVNDTIDKYCKFWDKTGYNLLSKIKSKR